MSRYVEITLEEVREAFSKKDANGVGWKESVVGREIVFDWTPQPGITIRVFSSFRMERNVARPCGQDSIKVCAIKLVKSRRVLRVEGWRTNLRGAIKHVYGEAVKRKGWRESPILTPGSSLLAPYNHQETDSDPYLDE